MSHSNIYIRDHIRRLNTDMELPVPLGQHIEALTTAFSNVHLETIPDNIAAYLPAIEKEGDDYTIRVPEEHEQLDTPQAIIFITQQFGHILLGHVDRHNKEYRRSANRLTYEVEIWAMNLLLPLDHFREVVEKHTDEENRVNIRKVAKYFNVDMRVVNRQGVFNRVFTYQS